MKSTPGMSLEGNMTPASTTMRFLPYSMTVMFFPISPRPPNGIIRRVFCCLEAIRLSDLLAYLYRSKYDYIQAVHRDALSITFHAQQNHKLLNSSQIFRAVIAAPRSPA